MSSEHRHPMGEFGTGADIETRRHRTDPYLTAEVAAAETGKAAEAEVGVGEMVQPQPPPHQEGQKSPGSGQNGREGGRLA